MVGGNCGTAGMVLGARDMALVLGRRVTPCKMDWTVGMVGTIVCASIGLLSRISTALCVERV